MKNIDSKSDNNEMKFTIYRLDQTKKRFVGEITTKLLNLALEEIFFRMVLPTDGTGPIYVGQIEPRLRFADLFSAA